MNDSQLSPEDQKLRRHLQAARPAPALPPRFGEHVWRRIEAVESPTVAPDEPGWLESLVALILRPRFAFATAAVLVVAGSLLGAWGSADFARKDAQARYVAAVAPHPLP